VTSRADGIARRHPGLGPLEIQVLDVLWAQSQPATVRDVLPAFPALAYTTLMTTMDRLHRKGLLEREAQGRAFAYRCCCTREELVARVATDQLVSILPDAGSSRPILSMLVEAVGRKDASLLDELEALIRAERDRHAPEEPL
jgi:predicted transcriptional regulator